MAETIAAGRERPALGAALTRDESDLPGAPLRLAILGDFDGLHTRRWLAFFVERGHEVHAISFYAPETELAGVRLHVLDGGGPKGGQEGGHRGATASLMRRLPPTMQRLIQARRYASAGLGRTLRRIAPDVFQAHYAVEHGFYGAFTGFHPYVVSTWGSDLFVEASKPLGRLVARRALGRADLVTANDVELGRRAAALGVPDERIAVVQLGVDAAFLAAPGRSVNLAATDAAPPTLLSDRALEPLYDVARVIRAFAALQERLPAARLVVANDGNERPRLEGLARQLGLDDAVRFIGHVDSATLRAALEQAHVYVSVPRSDSFAQSTLEAMAVGAFPVVSDLTSQDGWIEHRVNGLRLPAGDADALAEALNEAFTSAALRRDAVVANRAKVEADGDRSKNLLRLEREFYRLAGRPLTDDGA